MPPGPAFPGSHTTFSFCNPEGRVLGRYLTWKKSPVRLVSGNSKTRLV